MSVRNLGLHGTGTAGMVWLDMERGRIIGRKALVSVLAGEDASLVRAPARLVQYRREDFFDSP